MCIRDRQKRHLYIINKINQKTYLLSSADTDNVRGKDILKLNLSECVSFKYAANGIKSVYSFSHSFHKMGTIGPQEQRFQNRTMKF